MKQATGSNTPQSINKVSIQLTLDGHSFSAPALSGEFPGDGPVEVELLTPRTMLVPEELSTKSTPEKCWPPPAWPHCPESAPYGARRSRMPSP